MKITLAKALKLKNRLVAELTKIRQQEVQFNVVHPQKQPLVDVLALRNEEDVILNKLIELKTALALATAPISGLLISLAEHKSKILHFTSIPYDSNFSVRDTNGGHYYESGNPQLSKQTLDELVKATQNKIDELQDAIDEYNSSTKIEIAD